MKNKKTRVLLATHIGEPVGGITINYRTLLASSYGQHLEVRVVETSKGYFGNNEHGGFKIANWLNAVSNILSFVVALWRERPHLVHIGSASRVSFAKHSIMSLLAHWKGVKVVLQLHCSMSRLIPAQDTLWKHYVLFVLKRTNGIVTLSKEWDALSELLPDTKTCYIPNAIDVHPYRVLPRPRISQDDHVNLLFLGHIGREKGCFDLLSAVEQLQHKTNVPFCLHFVGETLYSGEKEQLQADTNARNLQNWIQIHDPEYDDQKIARLGISDIFVLPSYYEGMPMSVIEAMAAGLPVVASQVGGIPDQVVPEQNGLLVESGDVQAIVDVLLRLIENPSERLQMGLAGRQRAVDNFDIETKTNALIAFYRQLV